MEPSSSPAPSDATLSASAIQAIALSVKTDDSVQLSFAEACTSNPRNWSSRQKWAMTFATSICTLSISVGATIYSSGVPLMVDYFGASREVVTFGLSVYQLGFCFGPMVWGPLSEQFGRRPVFLTNFSVHFLFTLATALSRNVETMIVCRFFAGFFGSVALSVSPAILGDIFDAADRGLPMSFYTVGAFGGPVVGPITGAWVAQQLGWRWLFWVLTIFTGVSVVVGGLIPESFAPEIIKQEAAKLTRTTGRKHVSTLAPPTAGSLALDVKVSLIRPFKMLIREPIVLFFALYSAYIYGLLYGCFSAIPWVYHDDRGWASSIGSLPFISIGVGILAGVLANYFFNRSYLETLRAASGQLPPEARLPLCVLGGVALPLGFMVFAWTTLPQVHWIVSVVSIAPFGFAIAAVFLSMTSYLLDAYPLRAASAISCTAFTRSLSGAAFPLFMRQQLVGMGTQWTLFLYAMAAVVALPVPFVLLKFGERIRARSTLSTTASSPV